MGSIDAAAARYGGEGLLPVKHKLQAGPFTADLMEDGSLRYIMYGDREIIRSIYSAFRDENWGTVPVTLSSFNVRQTEQSFTVSFHAVHQTETIHFEWDGRITGDQGAIRFSMDGTAYNDFLKNRLGFCVLHPLDVAGTPVQVKTDVGTMQDSFAELITPHDPFTNMKSMHYPIDADTKVDILFEGDLFHTEDQRNWTDASYKTFCTPLDRPYPVRIAAGEAVRQSVMMRVTSKRDFISTANDDGLTLKVGGKGLGLLPKFGTWLAPFNRFADKKEIERLRRLHLSQLRVQINLLQPGWEQTLKYAAKTAHELHLPLEMEVLTDIQEKYFKDLMTFIYNERLAVSSVSPFPEGYDEDEKVETKCELSGSPNRACQFTTKRTMAEHARKWIDHYELDMTLGGGSRTNFTEFNRAVMPLDLLDTAEYALQPQTHAFDVGSLVETLETQTLTVRTAKSILAEHQLPLHINSVSFKWKVNPYATSIEGARVERSEQIDSRLHSLFGAGWTIGSISRIASEGIVQSINYYEHAGELGVMEEGGKILYPVYHALANAGEFTGGEMLPVLCSRSRQIEGLAVRKDSRLRIMLANMQNEAKFVRIDLSALSVGKLQLRMIDEENYAFVIHDQEGGNIKMRLLETDGGKCNLDFRPFAVAILDAEVKGT